MTYKSVVVNNQYKDCVFILDYSPNHSFHSSLVPKYKMRKPYFFLQKTKQEGWSENGWIDMYKIGIKWKQVQKASRVSCSEANIDMFAPVNHQKRGKLSLLISISPLYLRLVLSSTSVLLVVQHETLSGGRLNKKDGLTRYGDSHVKDKTS